MGDCYSVLSRIDISDGIEVKKVGGRQLKYLKWAFAWSKVMEHYPDAMYKVIKCPTTDKPYTYDTDAGYMVNTEVTIEGITRQMWLPVTDGANKAMKMESYTYSDSYGNERMVESATMFDINKALMRCLVKNMAMFGLGIQLYIGEDSDHDDKSKSDYNNTKKCIDCDVDCGPYPRCRECNAKHKGYK